MLIRIIPTLAFGFLFAALLGALLLNHETPLRQALVGSELPAFSLPPLYETASALESAKIRGEASIVNVFASWCVSCLVEHPQLMELSKRGVKIYGIAWNDDPESARAWLEKHGNPYYKIGVDKDGKIAKLLEISGAPESLIIGEDGIVISRYPGPITPNIAQELFP